MGRFDILEHTADIGIYADGESLEELFAQATKGLASIIGIWRPGAGEPVRIEVTGDDLGGLLVHWLSEVLYVHDTRVVAVTGLTIDAVREERAAGELRVAPLQPGEAEGVQVKAITYHDLSVARVGDLWVARVYVDI